MEFKKLIGLPACVAALNAPPKAIYAAAEKLGIPILQEGQALFFYRSDLPALEAEIKDQQATLPDMIELKEFAHYVGVSIKTVNRWISKKKITREVKKGAAMIPSSDLAKILAPEVPDEFLSLQVVSALTGVSIGTLRGRIESRHVKWIKHKRAIMIKAKDMPRLASFSSGEQVEEGFISIQDAAASLGIGVNDLRTAILRGSVKAQTATGDDGSFYYKMSPEQVAAARRYFHPNGISPDEIAAKLGITRSVVSRMLTKGKLKLAAERGRKLVAQESLDEFLRTKNGTTFREAATQLGVSLAEVNELLASGSLTKPSPDSDALISQESIDHYRTEFQPRTFERAASELGMTISQIQYLIYTGRLRQSKDRRRRCITVDEIRAFRASYLRDAVAFEEAARLIGKRQIYLRYLIDTKRLKSYFFGRIELVTLATLEEYKQFVQSRDMTIEQAAEYLNLPVAEVRKLIHEKRIYVTPSQQKIRAAALETFLEQRLNEKYIAVRDVVARYGIAQPTVYRLIKNCELAVEIRGRRMFVLRESVEQYLKAHPKK